MKKMPSQEVIPPPPRVPNVPVPEYVHEEPPAERLERLLKRYDFESSSTNAHELIQKLGPHLRHALNRLLTAQYDGEMNVREYTVQELFDLREQVQPLMGHSPELSAFVERILQMLFVRMDEQLLSQK